MKTHILSDAELLDILENDKWISSEEEFDDESECNYSSDGDDGEDKGNDLQNIVMSDYVGSEGTEVALHFSRNPAEEESVPCNRLHKIQPIVNYLNSKMNEIFEPTKNLSLDESMVLWRGRLIFQQYIKNKKHKFGVKVYMLTESWGLIHKIMIYSGQGYDISESMTHTEFVVDNLMSGLYHKGRSLYMDNFYNSVHLSQKLLQKKTYVTGTLRSNQDNICVVKWKDKRDVLTISSEFPHSMVEIEKDRRKGIRKDTIYYCMECNEKPGLCLESCFEEYHKKI
ncbi:hypothetical protein QTP88_014155 [Uroleucon formosanum]